MRGRGRTAPQVVIDPGQVCTPVGPAGALYPTDLGVRTWGTGLDGSTTLLCGTYGGDAVVVDAFVGPDRDGRRDGPDRGGDWGDDHLAEDRDDLAPRHDEDRSPLAVRWLEERQVALGYHGSASVIAMALARAHSSSSASWGWAS